MLDKQKLLSGTIARMEAVHKDGYHLESAWYAYAILEDRLRSILLSSGGAGLVQRANRYEWLEKNSQNFWNERNIALYWPRHFL